MNFLHLYALLCCLITSVLSQDKPQITRTIWPEIKKVGQTGYLNCTVTRQANNKVNWIHKNKNLILTSDDRVEVDDLVNTVVDGYPKYDVSKQIDGDMTTYTLIVHRLVLTDAGVYTCQIIIIAADEHPSKDGLMVVLIPPTIVQGRTTQTAEVEEGKQVTLTCDAEGYPTPNISWVRVNGDSLPPPYNRFNFKGRNLTLYNVTGKDRGMYRCIADNAVRPPAMYDATLYVKFRPYARPVQSSYGQASNREFDLTIECIIAGYPPPRLKWYKQDTNGGLTELTDEEFYVIHQLLSHGQTMSISEVWYQLIIINVRAGNYGRYICEGSNDFGVARAYISVYETSECQGASCIPEGGGASDASRSHLDLFVLAASYLILRL